MYQEEIDLREKLLAIFWVCICCAALCLFACLHLISQANRQDSLDGDASVYLGIFACLLFIFLCAASCIVTAFLKYMEALEEGRQEQLIYAAIFLACCAALSCLYIILFWLGYVSSSHVVRAAVMAASAALTYSGPRNIPRLARHAELWTVRKAAEWEIRKRDVNKLLP